MEGICTLALTVMVCLLIAVAIRECFGLPKLLGRIADAAERIADALERIAGR